MKELDTPLTFFASPSRMSSYIGKWPSMLIEEIHNINPYLGLGTQIRKNKLNLVKSQSYLLSMCDFFLKTHTTLFFELEKKSRG